jgi:hypothetical protein
VIASEFLRTDHCCRGYRGVGKSFEGALAPRRTLQDSRGYALAGFMGRQLVRESITRSLESTSILAMILSSKSSVIIFNVLQPAFLTSFAWETHRCLFGSRHPGARTGEKLRVMAQNATGPLP